MFIESAAIFGINPAAPLSMDTVNELASLAPFAQMLFAATKPDPETIQFDWSYSDYVDIVLHANWMDIITLRVEEMTFFHCDDCPVHNSPSRPCLLLCDKYTTAIHADVSIKNQKWTRQYGFSSLEDAQQWAENTARKMFAEL